MYVLRREFTTQFDSCRDDEDILELHWILAAMVAASFFYLRLLLTWEAGCDELTAFFDYPNVERFKRSHGTAPS